MQTDVRSTVVRQRFRWLLVVWTVGIWGSRVRTIFADDEVSGIDRFASLSMALVLVALAIAMAWTLVRRPSWQGPSLAGLAVLGIVRWSVRGPVILLSDNWEVGFKVVHTVLWLVTVALSLLAWREHRSET